ncbi:MAG: nucleotidyltransferase family protein, partial [Bacteroidales bacterium]|nr:nucleotidyltransferase family protein [Bacteroidales bacterium]
TKRLYFNQNDACLCKWKNEITNQEKTVRNCKNAIPFAFSGIHIINPKIFNYMKPGVYSIIDTYLSAATSEKITYFDHSETFWRDMGKPESFES